MYKRFRGFPKTQRERPLEVIVGYECSEPECDWRLDSKKIDYHKALEEFGKHNRKVHGMTIAVSMERVKGPLPRQKRSK